MNRNEKIIMGIMVAGILIFLTLSIIILFGKGKQNTTNSNTFPKVPTNLVTHKPYPTIPPIINTAVMVDIRRFNPATATIKKEGYVQFINVESEPITIEANDENSSIFNVGTLQPGEVKNVTPTAVGTYTYKNKNKPEITGIVIVQ